VACERERVVEEVCIIPALVAQAPASAIFEGRERKARLHMSASGSVLSREGEGEGPSKGLSTFLVRNTEEAQAHDVNHVLFWCFAQECGCAGGGKVYRRDFIPLQEEEVEERPCGITVAALVLMNS
jgi:hypothetical protein